MRRRTAWITFTPSIATPPTTTGRSLRGGRRGALALAVTAGVIVSAVASAHRRDEYLQAARLDVEPDFVELELDLTPGIAVADATIADLDRDRDGVVSEEERRLYVGRALAALILELDGSALHVAPIGATFPGLHDFRRGEGTIRLRSVALLPPQADGGHRLSFRNTNQRDGSVYLANALVPTSDRVTITAQQRDVFQRALTIDYAVRRGAAAAAPIWLLGGVAGMALVAGALGRPWRTWWGTARAAISVFRRSIICNASRRNRRLMTKPGMSNDGSAMSS